MYYRFENLDVWKLGRQFIIEIYKITKKFPQEELFGLTSQLRRAAVSIVLNIAEGSDRKSDADFSRFLRMSIGSIEESVTGLYIALDLGFINKDEFNFLYELSGKLISKVKALIKSIN